jgi:hypothetical protein
MQTGPRLAGPKLLAILVGLLAVIWIAGKLRGGKGQATSDHPEIQRYLDSTSRANPPAVAVVRSLSITREQLAAAFPEIQFNARTLADGQPSYKGTASDKGVILELTGPVNAPTSATAVVGITGDNNPFSARNLVRASRLVGLATGQAKECGDWFLGAASLLTTQGDQSGACGNGLIKVSAIKGAGLILVTIDPK